MQYVQEIKKSGVFMFLMPGAQLSAAVVLHNGQPAQNAYEGNRFFSSFVFFDVPPWEEESSNTKYVVTQNIDSLLNTSRLLLKSDGKPSLWRFTRTGHNSYFLFDTYIQLALLVLCWLILLVLHLIRKRAPKLVSPGYTLLHRVHEVVLFYVWIGALLEWLTFTQHSAYQAASLALSILIVLYFLLYEIYVFYQLIPYPYADIRSAKFASYIEKYSFFLRDLKFEEYESLSPWSVSHLIRPYNYQILTIFRMLWIISALPLFYDFSHGPIGCLVAVQSLELIRFAVAWPYHAQWRNIYKLVLEVLLLGFFCLTLADDIIVNSLYVDPNSVTEGDISRYYGIGWASFTCIMAYNIGFVIYLAVDIVFGCLYTNRERMEVSRRCFYREMLSEYEELEKTPKELRESSLRAASVMNMMKEIEKKPKEPSSPTKKRQLVEMLVGKGNLEEIDYDKLQNIKIKI